MDWARVKTALIIMLAVLNCFLAAVYFMRFSETRALERDALDNALSVIRSNGMDADAGVLDKSYEVIYTYEAKRDMDIESAIALALTGSGAGEEQGPNAIYYEGPGGHAKFWVTGSFEAGMISTPVTDYNTDALFELMGIDTGGAAITLERGEAVVSASFAQEADGIRIADCITSVYYDDNGKPFRVEGRRINGELIITDAVYSCSVITAVMSFVDYALKNDIASTRISEVELCYTVSVPSPGFYRLNPTWEITTDAGIFRIGVGGADEAVD